ncbi:PAS domain-containing protein [bacterium]|nr:PAS domain-containing protein [bacterium]
MRYRFSRKVAFHFVLTVVVTVALFLVFIERSSRISSENQQLSTLLSVMRIIHEQLGSSPSESDVIPAVRLFSTGFTRELFLVAKPEEDVCKMVFYSKTGTMSAEEPELPASFVMRTDKLAPVGIIPRDKAKRTWGTPLAAYCQCGKYVIIGLIPSSLLRVERKYLALIGGVFLAFVIIVAVLLGLAVSTELTSSLRKFLEGVQRVANGEFNFRLDESSDDEFGLLASNFNKMTNRISLYNKALQDRFNELKNLSQIVFQSKQEWQQTFDNISDIICILDENFNFRKVNKRLAALVGTHPRELIGRNFFSVVMGKTRPPESSAIVRCRNFKTSFTEEVTFPHFKGAYELTAYPLYDANERFYGIVVYAKERTEIKHLKQKLSQAERLATLGGFASGIVRELDKPLGVITGYIDLAISREKLSDETRNNLEVALQNARRARKIIDDLMLFSKPITLTRTHLNLQKLVQSVVTENFPDELSRIHIDNSVELPDVFVDEELTSVALKNILDNAVWATRKEGEINIRFFLGRRSVSIEVSDTGVGMLSEICQRATEPFFTTKDIGEGTGLGLTIADNIIKAHGGSLQISSEKGVGTDVVVTLPL